MKKSLFKMAAIAFGCLLQATSFAQMTPQDAISQMKRGINLGNTLEAPLEGEWVSHITQEYQFDMYKEA